MKKRKGNETNRPNLENTLDIIVEIPKKDSVIGRNAILKTLRRTNIFMTCLCSAVAIFSLIPIIGCIVAFDETFRWYYAILPLIFLCVGIAAICGAVSSAAKAGKRKACILNGDFTILKSGVREVYSEYNSPGEGTDYYIKVLSRWVSVGERVYDAVNKDKTCYVLSVRESGKKTPVLIYIGKCTFEEGLL